MARNRQQAPVQQGPPQAWPAPAPSAEPHTVVAPPVNGAATTPEFPAPPPPTGPSFPPAPRPGVPPTGRHRSSSRTLSLSLVATLTAILLAAVAIVLWRNNALPEAAGAATTDSPASETASPSDDGSGSSAGSDSGSSDSGSSDSGSGDPGDGSVALPPLPGDTGGETTLPGDTGGETTLPGDTGGETTLPDGTSDGDLGLSVPASAPACDGSWIVVLASVTDPAQYATGVQSWLDQYPGSQYLLTEGSCASLRQATPEGNLIYAVYSGPYTSPDQACGVRAKYGDQTYVKVLDEQTPPEQIWTC
jgi:serine/threonine-protein kinase